MTTGNGYEEDFDFEHACATHVDMHEVVAAFAEMSEVTVETYNVVMAMLLAKHRGLNPPTPTHTTNNNIFALLLERVRFTYHFRWVLVWIKHGASPSYVSIQHTGRQDKC